MHEMEIIAKRIYESVVHGDSFRGTHICIHSDQSTIIRTLIALVAPQPLNPNN